MNKSILRPTRLTLGLLALAAALVLSPSARATVVDLTTSLQASGEINGALFFASDQQPAGTGFIDSFIRVQNKGYEQGYNTDGGFPFDDKHPHNFQHSVLLSSLATFDISGTQYFKFMLDANQSSHQFPMQQLQFYTTNNPSQMTTTFNADGTLAFDASTHLAYNMNPGGGTGNSVLTTATGSGKFDAVVFVPVSDFNLSDKYVMLYFAGMGDGGFEEWTAATGVSSVPEVTPGSVIFGFLGLIVAAGSRRTLMARVRAISAGRKGV